MKKAVLLFVAMLLSTAGAFTLKAQSYPGVCPVDKHDAVNNVTYNVVEMLGLCWLKENLRNTKYSDGTDIPFAKPYQLQGVQANIEEMGLLYTWYSAVRVPDGSTNPLTGEVQGVCPNGWHLPSQFEWSLLERYATSQLMSSTLWLVPPGGGTDNFGFSATPAGLYNSVVSKYENLNGFAGWWASDAPAGTTATCPCIFYYCLNIENKERAKGDGVSVRCVMCPETTLDYTPASKEATIIGENPSETLTVTPNNNPTYFTYQWYNSSGIIVGATSQSYLANISDTYYCKLSPISGCPEVVSDEFTVTLNPIIVTPDMTAGDASSTPTLCINTALTDVTHTTTGATGIGTATGLPAGVTAAWASNTITISGTPTASGTFNYTIPLTGGTGTVNATGTITVNAAPAQPGTISVSPTAYIGFPTTASVIEVTGVSYTWTFSSGTWTQLSGGNTNSITFNPVSGNGTITVTPTGTNGCVGIARTSITIAVGDECGAYIAPGEWKKFMCRNLGADHTAFPFTPSAGLNGDYFQWGSLTPAATRDGIIGTWSNTPPAGWYGANSYYETTEKSDYDPCPEGYRVPTSAEWNGVFYNNTKTNIGDVDTEDDNNWSGCMFGDNLFLPLAGYHYVNVGDLGYRGRAGLYWTAQRTDTTRAFCMFIAKVDSYLNEIMLRSNALPIRCIEE